MATWSSQGRQGSCLWCLVPTWSAPRRGSAGRAGCPWRPPWTCRTSRSSRSSTSRWRRGHSLPTRHLAHSLQQSCALEQVEQQKRELGLGYIYEWPAALWTRAGQVNLAARHPWIQWRTNENLVRKMCSQEVIVRRVLRSFQFQEKNETFTFCSWKYCANCPKFIFLQVRYLLIDIIVGGKSYDYACKCKKSRLYISITNQIFPPVSLCVKEGHVSPPNISFPSRACMSLHQLLSPATKAHVTIYRFLQINHHYISFWLPKKVSSPQKIPWR